MGHNRVLLISLLGSTDNVGAKYLHAELGRQGIQSTLLFFTSADLAYCGRIADFVEAGKLTMVGMSLMSRFYPKAVALSQAIRARCSHKPCIVWGGIHPTIDPQSCFEHADYVCVGEAEQGLPTFVSQLGSGSGCAVKGFNARGAAELTNCEVVQDLDSIAYPEHLPPSSFITAGDAIHPLDARLLRRHANYNGTHLSVMSTRGCPFTCSYCCNDLLSKVNGRKVRQRGPASVLEEIRRNVERSPVAFNYVNFVDDCFMVHSTAWLREFVDGFRALGIPMIFRAIPDYITEEKMDILRHARCGLAMIGLQSGSDRTHRDVYARKYSREKLLECSRILHACRIPATYDVIIDNPYETSADWDKTIEVIAALPRTSFFFFYSLTFYRHTRLYEKAKQDGLDVDSHATKAQNIYNIASKESQLIRLAVFYPTPLVKWILRTDTTFSRCAQRTLNALARMVLEPMRYARLAYLSQQGRPGRLLKLFLASWRQFFDKMYRPSKFTSGTKVVTSDAT